MKYLFAVFLSSIQFVHAQSNFDFQGHRGARGLAPENTIPAFLEALQYGVTTLEMDVVITKDHKVLVSHDSWINKNFCRDIHHEPIHRKAIFKHNIYKLNYDVVKLYDCGSLYYPRFPNQKLQTVSKPLLSDVILFIQNYISENHLPQVKYNIEIKSTKWGDGIFHPKPEVFAELLVEVLRQEEILKYAIIQSFDVRPLQYLHQKYPEIQISYLVDNQKSLDKNLKRLGFIPDIYSPNYLRIDKNLVQRIHEKGMKLVPWTVNDTEEMKKLIRWNVDGWITDYPDKGREVLDELLPH